LTPEAFDAVLADFRIWLLQTTVFAPANGAPPSAEKEPVDLHTLVSQFVALRQEINLQTKSSRAQMEQNAQALQQLGQALQSLEQAGEKLEEVGDGGQDELLRPVLKTLVDLYDILALADREVERVETTLLPALREMTESLFVEASAQASPSPKTARWSGWFRNPNLFPPTEAQPGRQDQKQKAEQAVERVRQLVSSILTGYAMSVQRIDRAIQQQDLEPIPTVGEPFDPETMEVVGVVSEPGRQATEVVEEVRRGYMRNGRVFRYAQVKVAKPG
jgi:hypothetical protein